MSTIKQTSKNYTDALSKLRDELKLKRGYAPRIAKRLKIETRDVYGVAYGRIKNPVILKELINESQNATTRATECFDLMSNYSPQVSA